MGVETLVLSRDKGVRKMLCHIFEVDPFAIFFEQLLINDPFARIIFIADIYDGFLVNGEVIEVKVNGIVNESKHINTECAYYENRCYNTDEKD